MRRNTPREAETTRADSTERINATFFGDKWMPLGKAGGAKDLAN